MIKGNIRRKKYAGLILIIVIISLLNYLGGMYFFRIDLTSEKRFSLNPTSRKILSELSDVVYVRVFLEGDLPSDLIRFSQAIKETLINFRAYAGKNLEYEFVNIYSESDIQIRNKLMNSLVEKGLKVTDIRIRDDQGGFTTKLIFPGALISYKGTEFPVNLLKNNPGLPYQVNLNNSVQSLEYEFIRAIKSLTNEKLEKIAFIEGHKELDELQVNDISSELSLFFQVDRGTIQGNLTNLLNYKALIIAQPLEKYNERDKFVLDQYIMRGGKILFFLDPVQTFTDSLKTGRTFTEFQDVNLYDLLFKYGIRISYNLVKDIQCNYIKVESSLNGDNKKISYLPWVYYPLLTASPDNKLTRGLNYIKTEFLSVIDTTSSAIPGLKRSILLTTSDTCAMIENPGYISMSEISDRPDIRQFNKSKLPVAVLVQGIFPSFYKNYGIPEGVTPKNIEILSESKNTMIFVAGDGDMICNEVQLTSQGPVPYPLGYDKDTRQTFGNKEFIMNVINYMTDDEDLISLRSKEFKLRLLDRTKIRTTRSKIKWQLMNTFLPIVLVIFFGLIFQFIRKRKYSK